MSATTDVLPQPKFTVIYDNRTCSTHLTHGFGFSCFIEWEGRNILFDTGGNKDVFLSNTKKKGIHLDTISYVVFSHHHWDHTAGFEEILTTLKSKTTVYIPKLFSNSLLKTIPKKLDLHQVDSFQKIDTNIYSLVLKGKLYCGLSSLYEQALVFDTPKGLVILTGCAHPGIITIIKTAQKHLPGRKIHLVMGGFHLHHSFSCTISKVVRKFQELGVEKVAPCHCAGDTAISKFKNAYGDNYLQVGTGSVIS